jgi:hypothetical protein
MRDCAPILLSFLERWSVLKLYGILVGGRLGLIE